MSKTNNLNALKALSNVSKRDNFNTADTTNKPTLIQAVSDRTIPKKRGRKQVRGDMKRISFLLDEQLYQEFKQFCAETGQMMQHIIQYTLQEFLHTEDKPVLRNSYALQSTGNVQRGVDIEVDLAEKLDEYVANAGVTKRFVIESLLAKYLQEHQ